MKPYTLFDRKGFAYVESLLLLPALGLFASALFLIPLLHLQKWNAVFADQEYEVCRRYLKNASCDERKQRLFEKMQILKLDGYITRPR